MHHRPDHRRTRRARSALAALVALAGIASGCVTGDGGSAAGEASVIVGATLVASQVAQSAQNGNAPARSVWCATLGKVDAQLALWAPSGERSEDELVDELTPAVNRIARDAGYVLHQVQIRALIVDAAHVRADQAAFAAESGKCR